MVFRCLYLVVAVITLINLTVVPVLAAESHPHGMSSEHDEHGMAESAKGVSVTRNQYQIPVMTLVREDGAKIQFPAAFDSGKPVLVNFIFTSCTTVCPILSRVFVQVQKKMGEKSADVSMISFTIDPQYDTPERLKAFSVKMQAGPQWHHYTGKLNDIVKLQQAFQVYTGDKMSHPPVTFLKDPKSPLWVRLNGVATSDEILGTLDEFKQVP